MGAGIVRLLSAIAAIVSYLLKKQDKDAKPPDPTGKNLEEMDDALARRDTKRIGHLWDILRKKIRRDTGRDAAGADGKREL